MREWVFRHYGKLLVGGYTLLVITIIYQYLNKLQP